MKNVSFQTEEKYVELSLFLLAIWLRDCPEPRQSPEQRWCVSACCLDHNQNGPYPCSSKIYFSRMSALQSKQTWMAIWNIFLFAFNKFTCTLHSLISFKSIPIYHTLFVDCSIYDNISYIKSGANMNLWEFDLYAEDNEVHTETHTWYGCCQKWRHIYFEKNACTHSE